MSLKFLMRDKMNAYDTLCIFCITYRENIFVMREHFYNALMTYV